MRRVGALAALACLAVVTPESRARAEFPDDAIEIAVGPAYGGSWSELPTGVQAWYGQHSVLGAALEIRGVVDRSFVIAFRADTLNGTNRASCPEAGCAGPTLWEHRLGLELGVGVRTDLARGDRATLALEATGGAALGWITPAGPLPVLIGFSERWAAGGFADARLVIQPAPAVVLTAGLRARVAGSSASGTGLDAELVGVVTIGGALDVSDRPAPTR